MVPALTMAIYCRLSRIKGLDFGEAKRVVRYMTMLSKI